MFITKQVRYQNVHRKKPFGGCLQFQELRLKTDTVASLAAPRILQRSTSERQMQMCTAAEGLEFLAGCLFAAGEMAADHAVFGWHPLDTEIHKWYAFRDFLLLESSFFCWVLFFSEPGRSKTQSTYNQRTINLQSTYNQLTINLQSTYNHQYLCLGFCVFCKNWFSQYCTASPRRPQRVLLCSYLLCPCGATRAAAGASEVPKIDGIDMHWYGRYGQEIDSVSGSHWFWLSSCSWFLPEELPPQLPERHSNSLRLGLGQCVAWMMQVPRL